MAIIKPSGILVDEIMSTNVVSVGQDATLLEAASLLSKNHFDGLPIVDKDNILIGILTEYDMLLKCAAINAPDGSEMSECSVGEVMNKDPLIIQKGATYEEALRLFKDHHRVNPIPVVDGSRRVVGVVSRYDILKPLYTRA